MINLLLATQTAVFKAMSEHTGLTALAPVYQHVPQDTQPPMTIVGKIESENIGGKGDQLERITVDIVTVYRGTGRAAMLDIMHQQRLAIEAGDLAFAGVEFGTAVFEGAGADGPARDGVTYAGIQSFTIDAQPE